MMFRVSWRTNGDNFDVALAINRLLARGTPVWWCTRHCGPAEAGDYLVDSSRELEDGFKELGVSIAPWDIRVPEAAIRLRRARIALLAGTASRYPYFAFYALALLRLGLSYRPVDGSAIAAGILAEANLFALPGGFAFWGLDSIEESPGADAQVRAFIERDGACLGTCGGASYLSSGRPSWTGTAAACPRYTHEYLQTGAGVISVSINHDLLGLGCPPTMEMPYYHGPVYDEVGSNVHVAATFRDLCITSRLFIDNPLTPGRFERDMAGRAAILAVDGPRGRAILFSPHPEMGDLVRKYISLDGYVRHYLPIRGHRVMEETLAFYKPLESPSFRLMLNAIHALTAGTGPDIPPPMPVEPFALEYVSVSVQEMERSLERAADSLDLPQGNGHDTLVRGVAENLHRRIAPAAARLGESFARLASGDDEAQTILGGWIHLAEAATQDFATGREEARPLPQRLMELDLAISLCEAWGHLSNAHNVLDSVEG